MSKKNVILPLAIVTNTNLSASAKVIYAVLKSFQNGKTASQTATSVMVTHGQITERSNLSKHTVVKALNRLAETGWIGRQRNVGSANRYIFMTPTSEI